jgi:hypothetical protein
MKPKEIDLFDEMLSLVMLALVLLVPFGLGVAVGLIINW